MPDHAVKEPPPWQSLCRALHSGAPRTIGEPAYIALSPLAKALYIRLKLEWKGRQYNNNGKVRFSYRQAAAHLGCAINTVAKAFQALQAKGFIFVTELGALGVEGEARGPAYELTEHPLPLANTSEGRKLYQQWSPENDFAIQKHNANNRAGKNGRKSRGTAKQNPMSKKKTVPC